MISVRVARKERDVPTRPAACIWLPLATALCPAAEAALVPASLTAREASDTEPEFLTEAELQRRERENLQVILEKAHWKIKGADGAAELLEVKVTTLKARMKKMGLKRPV